MKHWWQSVVKDYFTFSKKERIAIVVLIIVGAGFYFFPKIKFEKKPPIDNSAFEKDIAQLKVYVDSSRPANRYARNDDESFDYYQPKKYAFDNSVKGELFPFDPNTLDAEGWKRLGVRDRTIQTIQKFVAKGYKFRKPEDIKKIYGLKPNEADRLLPFVQIASQAESISSSTSATPSSYTPPTSTPRIATIRFIEINSADTSAFISLPGIGSKLASRIVNFRDKLGGFATVNQLGETYGLPDSTFQKIRDKLQCNTNGIKKYDINTVDINALKTHPYIKWNIANAIINYRQQHGNYKALEDLMKIDIINKEVFGKMSPYLTL
jgi:competence ComEA-like helix-hairpin-helix protein